MTLAQNFISDSTADARDYQFAVASVSDVLAESIEALWSSATAREVGVVLSAAQNHHDLIRADSGMLTRAFVNMLENAIRHSPPGAVIRVCCSVDEAPGPSETHRAPGTQEAVITIHDEGTGMAPAKLALLLDPAQSSAVVDLHDDTEGAVNEPMREPNHGFGFVMVRQVVSAHDGWIAGWSMVGAGTTFALGFPLVAA